VGKRCLERRNSEVDDIREKKRLDKMGPPPKGRLWLLYPSKIIEERRKPPKTKKIKKKKKKKKKKNNPTKKKVTQKSRRKKKKKKKKTKTGRYLDIVLNILFRGTPGITSFLLFRLVLAF